MEFVVVFLMLLIRFYIFHPYPSIFRSDSDLYVILSIWLSSSSLFLEWRAFLFLIPLYFPSNSEEMREKKEREINWIIIIIRLPSLLLP